MATKFNDWYIHPSDDSVDVAIARIGVRLRHDNLAFPLLASATSRAIQTEGIDIGDDVFLTGLFVSHAGRRRNIPIIRVGNIAAMPTEKVSTKIGDIEAYLIEARSIGGLSGSPVFVHLGGDSRSGVRGAGPRYLLLGVMHGHFDKKHSVDSVSDDEVGFDAMSDDATNEETVNMGIGIVVPIDKAIEIMDSPKVRERDDEDVRRKTAEGTPTMDLADGPDPSEFTQRDFEDALRKVSRKIAPEKPKE